MTVSRIGSTKQYAEGWDRAFGKKTSSPTSVGKKSKKVRSTKRTATAKKAKAKVSPTAKSKRIAKKK